MQAAMTDIARLQKGRPATTEEKGRIKKNKVKAKDDYLKSVHPKREIF